MREKALAELVARGSAAIPLLRQASKDPDDVEVAHRARHCLQIIEGTPTTPTSQTGYYPAYGAFAPGAPGIAYYPGYSPTVAPAASPTCSKGCAYVVGKDPAAQDPKV